MKLDREPSALQGKYQNLLRSVHHLVAEEDSLEPIKLAPAQLNELHGLWHAGQLGRREESQQHGSIAIRDFGEWNRERGADFLRIEMELNGKWQTGHAVFTCQAEDWKKRHCDSDELYRDTILHICLQQRDPKHRSITCSQREAAVLCVPEDVWREALRLSPKLSTDNLALCRHPLEENTREQAIALLQSAAAYRVACKRNQFGNRVQALGKSQAWYEAWAESLGYYSNRHQMKLLARRAPLRELTAENAEAILFGTAGFLIPILPDKAMEEDRLYHRITWDIWWPVREQFGLIPERRPQWTLAGQRPMNHPNRRVAALAATVQRWEEFEALLDVTQLAELENFRQSLNHIYWNYHSALPSNRSARAVSLVGKERLRAFLINHLLVNDDSPLAWQIYCEQQERSIGGSIKRAFLSLFGERQDLENLLPYCYVQQGLIQLHQDFLVKHGNKRKAGGSYPQELADWAP